MNSFADTYGLVSTHYANPHGLCNNNNKSTSYDIARLCFYAMKLPLFRQVVGTIKHRAQIFNKTTKVKRIQEWVNTNKLLPKGFCGVKTGVTEKAGPCLASCYMDKGIKVIIVILACKGYMLRFPETELLLEHFRQLVAEKEAAEQERRDFQIDKYRV